MNNISPSKQTKKFNIFICDDEKQIALSIQKLIIKYFTQKNIFDLLPDIYIMKDGIECIFQAYRFYLENNQSNLIIIDQNMDFLTGDETCRIIKKIRQFDNIKMYLMTGENGDMYRDNYYVDGVIEKPLTYSHIESILKVECFA